jgi:hypothetical protein
MLFSPFITVRNQSRLAGRIIDDRVEIIVVAKLDEHRPLELQEMIQIIPTPGTNPDRIAKIIMCGVKVMTARYTAATGAIHIIIRIARLANYPVTRVICHVYPAEEMPARHAFIVKNIETRRAIGSIVGMSRVTVANEVPALSTLHEIAIYRTTAFKHDIS